ncbi:MAG: hypothetical protein KF841_08935 [Phycisphaerae bacterium]|nr:hypothetical protein [Phycisphaerae bacterium]
MNASRDHDPSSNGFAARLDAAMRERPNAGTRVGFAKAPGVFDVMGGIGEDAGSLVLTATTALSHHTAVWPIARDRIHLTLHADCRNNEPLEHEIPASAFLNADVEKIKALCADAEWAAPTLLAIHRMIADEIAPPPSAGLAIFIEHDFSANADLGRMPSQAASAAVAYRDLNAMEIDPLRLAQAAASVVSDLLNLHELRKTMTAIVAPARRSLLQMTFHPNATWDLLELPQGIVFKAVATRLSRPTTTKRLIETRVCSEMGHRVIQYLQKLDGQPIDGRPTRLASITPSEFVEKFRDRMPSKITQQQFMTKFGEVRGLTETGAGPKDYFKIRSRAEHHIYENRRVHDFSTNIVRARRSTSPEALIAAGDLMYASHWSHSQRCGIGGVETDRLVNAVRELGHDAGLFGAKVTAGGQGGEMVVLMRDDPAADAALADAVAKAAQASGQAVAVFEAMRIETPRSQPASDAHRSPAAVSPT